MSRLIQIEVRNANLLGEHIIVEVDALSDSQIRVKSVQVLSPETGDPLPDRIMDIDFRQCMKLAIMLKEGLVPRLERNDADAKGRSRQSAKVEGVAKDDARPTEGPSYSRMPTAQESLHRGAGMPPNFGAMYWRLGTVPKLAKHYDVPRQIVRDWVRELRAGEPAKRTRRLRN